MSSMPVKCTVAADRARLLNPCSIMPESLDLVVPLEPSLSRFKAECI